jgi:hypothetical protein
LIDRRQPFARALYVSEASFGFAACVVRIHSLSHEIPHCHLEVESQLVVDRALDPGAIARDVEQAAYSVDSRHDR